MLNALVSARELVTAGHKIIRDNPIATVVNKLTNEVVMEAEFDPLLCTWDVYPDSPVPYNSVKNKK